MKKQYAMIDILKFISAILIVAIHTQPFKDYTESVFYLPYTFLKCFAIPFFFVSSSFLFFKRIDLNEFGKLDNLKYLVAWTTRLLKIYVFYTVINLLVDNVTGNLSMSINLLQFIVLGRGNGYLWFLAALIVSVLLLYLLNYFFGCVLQMKHALGIVVFVLIVGTGILMVILQFYHGYFVTTKIKGFIELYYRNFDNVRNVISGIFYTCIGLLVVICESFYQPILNKILCLISVIVAYFEFVAIKDNSMWYEAYSTGWLAIFIFLLMLECIQYSKEVVFTKYLRKASNVYYLQQRYVIIVIAVINKYVYTNIFESNINLFFAVILVLSLLTIVYVRVETTSLQKVLKYMY